MQLRDILQYSVEHEASDVYIVPGSPVMLKVRGVMQSYSDARVLPDESERLISEMYQGVHHHTLEGLKNTGDDDFSFSIPTVGRFRCNTYMQRGTLAAVLRVVAFELPDYKKLRIPETVIDLARKQNGLILVTGPAGSGKSTTMACIIDRINHERSGHIITLEDPIEYLHPHRKSVVSQREIMLDTQTFAHALRAALRQAPDVIMLGEMRDFETMQTAITASETGHLLISSLHTLGAAKTIDRIVDVFPANQQQQIRTQLSMVLQAVVSQQLITAKNGEIIPVFEIMITNSAIQNMIREGKIHQLDNAIYAGAAQGMVSMDNELVRLVKEGAIDKETAVKHALNMEMMARKLGA